MFTIDNTITEMNIREKNILKLLFSMNVHQVATPEMILEEAKSYILFFRESAGKVSAYIALYLTVTDRRLFYVHSSNPFDEREMDAIEQEALEFSEGLGAMLDEKDFTMMTIEDKKAWIDAQEIFNPKIESAPAPPSSPQPAPEAQAASTPPAPSAAQPTPPAAPPVQEILKESVIAPPAVQVSPAAPAPTLAQPTPPLAPPVQESSKEPVTASPAVQAAPPVQQTQPSAEPVSHPEPSDLHEQKIQNRKTAAVSRYAVSSAEAARKRQEIMQKAIKEGIAKPPRQAHGPAVSSTGVVSRDREALARLLTSF